MTDVKDLLIKTLSAVFPEYQVYLQGSLSDSDGYDEAFFTFWNNYANDASFYDNAETQTIWSFDVNFYATDPVLVNTVLLEAKKALKTVGFIPDGSGHDVASDEDTHTGRGLTVLFLQKVRL